MMNNSDTIHFETRVPVREVMRSHPTTIDVGKQSPERRSRCAVMRSVAVSCCRITYPSGLLRRRILIVKSSQKT